MNWLLAIHPPIAPGVPDDLSGLLWREDVWYVSTDALFALTILVGVISLLVGGFAYAAWKHYCDTQLAMVQASKSGSKGARE
jgi:hypothetical protein